MTNHDEEFIQYYTDVLQEMMMNEKLAEMYEQCLEDLNLEQVQSWKLLHKTDKLYIYQDCLDNIRTISANYINRLFSQKGENNG